MHVFPHPNHRLRCCTAIVVLAMCLLGGCKNPHQPYDAAYAAKREADAAIGEAMMPMDSLVISSRGPYTDSTYYASATALDGLSAFWYHLSKKDGKRVLAGERYDGDSAGTGMSYADSKWFLYEEDALWLRGNSMGSSFAPEKVIGFQKNSDGSYQFQTSFGDSGATPHQTYHIETVPDEPGVTKWTTEIGKSVTYYVSQSYKDRYPYMVVWVVKYGSEDGAFVITTEPVEGIEF